MKKVTSVALGCNVHEFTFYCAFVYSFVFSFRHVLYKM